MNAAEVTLTRDYLYTNLATLESLASFATSPPGIEPPLVPGLTDEAADLMRTPQGKGTITTWLSIFNPTLSLLRQFRDGDLRRAAEVVAQDPTFAKDLDDALEASKTAIRAAAARVNFVAKHPPTDDVTRVPA